MPLMECELNNKPGVKWGESGKCYTFNPDSEGSRKTAIDKAIKQAVAIGDLGEKSNFAELKDVEIFASGVWNGHEFKNSHLLEIAENTNKFLEKGTNKPPLKLGHSSNQILKGQSDGDPALGWMENVRVSGEKLIADFKNVPEIIAKSIKNKLWDKVSVEMKRHPETGYFLSAAALLGADLPAVKTIDDLSLFLASENEETESPSGFQYKFSINEPVILLDDENKNVSHKEEMELQELEKQFSEAKSEIEKQKEIIVELQNKERQMKVDAARQEALSFFKEEVKSGKLQPAMYQQIEEKLCSSGLQFSEEDGLHFSLDFVKQICGSYKEQISLEEKSFSEESEEIPMRADEKLEKEAIRIMNSTGMNYSEATSAALKEKPELATEYSKYKETFQSR